MEAAFWRSNTASRAVLSLNQWGLATSLLVNFIAGPICMVSGNNKILSSSAITNGLFMASVLLLCFQAWCAYRHPWVYIRHGTLINVSTRLVRILQTVFACTDPQWYPMLLTTAQEDAAGSGYKNLIYLVCTWPWFSLLNAINFPLPWRWQWPIVVLKCCIDILLGVPVINCVLQHPESRLGTASGAACKTIMGSILAVGQLFVPIQTGSEQAMCGPYTSGLAIALFLLLFVGTAVPLQITYWYEQLMKVRFLAANGYTVHRQHSKLLQKMGWSVAWALLCCLVTRHMLSFDYFSTKHCSWSMGPA